MMRPLVGIAIIAVSPGIASERVLVSERLSGHGKGSFQLPGGHLEFGESFEECARRELLEETNLRCSSLKLIYVTNNVFAEEDGGPKHYVTLFLRGDIDDPRDLRCLEPEKNSPWQWIDWNELKEKKLFAPLRQAIDDREFHPFQSSGLS